MNTRHLLLIPVVLALFLTFPTPASADTVIVVEAVDEQGNPVSGADVVIVDSAGKVIRGKTGGKKGGFKTFWQGNNAGEVFTITVTKGNKTSTVKKKCAPPPKKTKAKVTLKPKKANRRALRRFPGDAGEERPPFFRGATPRERENAGSSRARVPAEAAPLEEEVAMSSSQARLQEARVWAMQSLQDTNTELGEFRTIDREVSTRANLIAALTARARAEAKDEECEEESSEECGR